MSSEYNKHDYAAMAADRRRAFCVIAEKLGKKHPITKMMGEVAWGRNDFETGPELTLRKAVREMSALDGAFGILNRWARDNDSKAQRFMIKVYPRGFRKRNSAGIDG